MVPAFLVCAACWGRAVQGVIFLVQFPKETGLRRSWSIPSMSQLQLLVTCWSELYSFAGEIQLRTAELWEALGKWAGLEERDLAPQPAPQTVTRQATHVPDTPGTDSSLKFIPPLILGSLSTMHVSPGCAKCRARRLGC